LAAREDKLGDEENQALASHARKVKRKKEVHSHKTPHGLQKTHKFKKDFSNYMCYTCHKMGHIAINCPNSKGQVTKGKYKRYHAHVAEDDEPNKERASEDESSEEYVLISDLIGTFAHGSDTWIINSGAYNHMTGYKDSFLELVQKDSPHKVKLSDDYQYPIKGVGEAYYRLYFGKPMKMKDVLYVPGLKKNILSILALDEKGFIFSFTGGEVLMWAKGKSSDDAVVIGVEEGGIYKLKGHSVSALVHITVTPSELWNRIFSHIHYKSLSIMRKMVTGFPQIQVNHEGICNGCAQGNHVKKPFPSSDIKAKGALEIIHSYVCGPMSAVTTPSLRL
jgi:hypothetical protein